MEEMHSFLASDALRSMHEISMGEIGSAQSNWIVGMPRTITTEMQKPKRSVIDPLH